MFLNLGMMRHGGFTLPGAIHTSGIYPSSRLSESYVGQCWTPDQGGVYRVAGSGYGQVRGAKLATTVAEGAILGPELVPGTSSTLMRKADWNVTGEDATHIVTDVAGGLRYQSSTTSPVLTIGKLIPTVAGKRYQIAQANNVTVSGNLKVDSFPGLKQTNGVVESIASGSGFTWSRDSANVDITLGSLSIREVIPVWLAPDTYPTRSVRTRFGSALVPTGTSVGMVSSPAFTNKVTARKTNPTDLTNIVMGGNASAVLSVVTESAAALQSAVDVNGNTVDLTQICSTLKVYELDNTLGGSGDAYIQFSGFAGNTNKHSGRGFCSRVSGASPIRIGWSSTGKSEIGSFDSASYVQKQGLDLTVVANTYRLLGSVPLGCKARFILPELVESSYLPADPIVPLTPAADTLAAFTRAAVYAEHNTSGVFPTVSVVETLAIGHADNPYTTQATRMSDGSVVPVVSGASWAQNFAVFGTCVPDFNLVNDSTSRSVLSSFVSLGEYLYINLWNNLFSISKRIASTSYTPSVALNYTANAPFDYLAIQTIHGMAIRVRPHATMTWSAWATNATTNGKKPAPIGSKYQIGALNGAAGIAGTHPKVSILELGNQESLAAYQDRAMLLAGRITG